MGNHPVILKAFAHLFVTTNPISEFAPLIRAMRHLRVGERYIVQHALSFILSMEIRSVIWNIIHNCACQTRDHAAPVEGLVFFGLDKMFESFVKPLADVLFKVPSYNNHDRDIN